MSGERDLAETKLVGMKNISIIFKKNLMNIILILITLPSFCPGYRLHSALDIGFILPWK